VWSSTATAVAAARSPAVPRRAGAWPARTRPARIRRIRRWFRIGALLTILGAVRLARAARVGWEPVYLLVGFLITVTGFALPAAGWAFLLGLLAMIVTLLKGIGGQHRRRDPVRRMRPTL
jgi:hypothetical protein